MTSKISFSKLIKEDIKKRAWLLLLSITIFIIIIPVLTAIKIEGALPGGVSMVLCQDLVQVKMRFSSS